MVEFRKRNRLAAFALVLFAALLMAAQRASAQTAAGTLSALSGTVTVTRGTAAPIPGTHGMALQVGDKIVTGPASSATITLSDGTQMELTDSGTLTIDKELVNSAGARQSTQVSLLGGIVRSLVRFTPGTPPNYEVHTPNAVAAARGTSYDTQYQTGTSNDKYPGCLEFTNVSVFDGTVRVSSLKNPSSPPVDVTPGKKVVVPCGLAPALAGLATTGGFGVGTTGVVVGGAVVGAGTGVGLGVAAAEGAFSSPNSTPVPFTSSR
jgi:ferric-dicitrate binding protein FerR (iron transport regulator)